LRLHVQAVLGLQKLGSRPLDRGWLAQEQVPLGTGCFAAARGCLQLRLHVQAVVGLQKLGSRLLDRGWLAHALGPLALVHRPGLVGGASVANIFGRALGDARRG